MSPKKLSPVHSPPSSTYGRVPALSVECLAQLLLDVPPHVFSRCWLAGYELPAAQTGNEIGLIKYYVDYLPNRSIIERACQALITAHGFIYRAPSTVARLVRQAARSPLIVPSCLLSKWKFNVRYL